MEPKQDRRFGLVKIFLLVLMASLLLKLFSMQIVNGKAYREDADQKRFKSVEIKAPRGNIYDRNGKLMAGSHSDFVVQILKDDFNMNDQDEKNENLEKLVRYLEEDGAVYTDGYEIGLNEFAYKSEDMYLNKKSPEDQVLDGLNDKDRLKRILGLSLSEGEGEKRVFFSIAQRAINAIKAKHIDLPIKVEEKDGRALISYEEGEDLDSFFKEYGIKSDSSPADALADLLLDDRSSLKNILKQPASRLLIYEEMKDEDFMSDIMLLDYAYASDLDYIENKSKLKSQYPEISMETSAKDDFIVIVKKNSLPTLLSMVTVDEDGEFIVPASDLIDRLKRAGRNPHVEYKINDSKDGVNLLYEEGHEREGAPADFLIRLAEEKGILDDFITSDDIKSLAQSANQANGINPHISVLAWEYTYQKEKNDFLEKYKLDKNASAEEAFKRLKEYYGIKSNDKYKVISMFSIYDQIKDHGLNGYQPLNLCYNLSEETIAKVEENIPEKSGIRVGSAPIRYYPGANTASHVMGYLGKISSSAEQEKYTEEKGYAKSSIIGKTGLEEAFESTLKGKDGVRRVEVDSNGNTKRVLETIGSSPGNDLYTTIDLDLQKKAEESLKKSIRSISSGQTYESEFGNKNFKQSINCKSGALVAIDVHTGEVLAMASYPDYDPNLFATGISESDWENLTPNDEDNPLQARPMLNIAVQSAIQPGSTFKLVISLAALEKGQDPNSNILDSGYFQIGDTRFGDWLWNQSRRTHGYEDLYGAIKDSCNYYYYALAYGSNQTTGQKTDIQLNIEDLTSAARKLGLDETTGLETNVPAETKSRIPTAEDKMNGVKNRLTNFLEGNLKNYETRNISDQEAEDNIKRIVSWLDEDDLSRQQVSDNLYSMGYEAEIAQGEEKLPLTDIIKYHYINEAKWNMSDMMNTVIGQGENLYTPVQLVRMTAAFANGGYKTSLSLADKVVNPTNGNILFENKNESQKIEVKDDKYFSDVAKGMNMAATTGSKGDDLSSLPFEIALKTGTAEVVGKNPDGSDYNTYAWTVAFAPYEEPEIAICSVLVQGGSGSVNIPMIRDVVAQYFDVKPKAQDDQAKDGPISQEAEE